MAKQQQADWDPQATAAVNARRRLPGIVATYFAEAREILADIERRTAAKKRWSPERLHRLRLISKRLRYTLELFRPCYSTGLDIRLAELKRLQDVLGEINDAATSAALIRKVTGSDRMLRYLEQRTAQKMAEFRRAWKEFDAPGSEERWLRYLARGAREGVKQ